MAKEAAAKAKRLAAKKGKKGKASKKKKSVTMKATTTPALVAVKDDQVQMGELDPAIEQPSVDIKVDGVD